MGLEEKYSYGQTPLDEDEKVGLRSPSVNTKWELDQLEKLNIEKAVEWSIHGRFRRDQVLNEAFVKRLHLEMFGNVWDWAGTFRRSDKNIGVEWNRIGIELKKLLDDTEYWLTNETFAPDEIAIRFKYRMVSIHCFPNGNGRHSRLMADILVEKVLRRKVFSWGLRLSLGPEQVRREYIRAIQEADQGDIFPLLQFARS